MASAEWPSASKSTITLEQHTTATEIAFIRSKKELNCATGAPSRVFSRTKRDQAINILGVNIEHGITYSLEQKSQIGIVIDVVWSSGEKKRAGKKCAHPNRSIKSHTRMAERDRHHHPMIEHKHIIVMCISQYI